MKYAPLMVFIRDPVFYIWPQIDQNMSTTIGDMAAGVTYLGRAKTPVSVSLVKTVPNLCYRITPSENGEKMLRVPGPGRLNELDTAFAAGRRANVASMIGYTDARDPVAHSPWGELLALLPEPFMPMRDTAKIAGALRASVLSRAGNDASSILHGHEGNHAAWTVLPDVGHVNARGRVLGVGLWLPRRITEDDRTRCVLPLKEVDHVCFRGQRISVGEPPAHLKKPVGLHPKTWVGPARRWASVTPVVMDRHPKRHQSVEDVIAESVAMAGFPPPSFVEVGQVSAFYGVPPALKFRPRNKGKWIHVALTFDQRVSGPMLIGRERHFGMGLMRPWEH